MKTIEQVKEYIETRLKDVLAEFKMKPDYTDLAKIEEFEDLLEWLESNDE